MADKAASQRAFSLAEARHIVKDLFTPNPAVYWTDFLLSQAGAAICFVLVRRVLVPFSLLQAIAFVACGLLTYRSVLFIHELVHIRDKGFRNFRIVWNALCGIPLLIPTFLYYTHIDHHMRKHFGTEHDGEYLPLASRSPWHIVLYLCQPFVVPLIAVVRFTVLSPISWVSPTFRDFVHRHASSMVIDIRYIRPLPTFKTMCIMRMQEALCFAWCAGLAVVLSLGLVPIGFLITGYLLSVFVLMINALRTLGAHRYIHGDGDVTFLDQLLDSVNYPYHPLISSLWAPVGLRYHALHHLFPSLPYHNLDEAHRRLMAQLPANSPYRLTESPSLTASLVKLWRTSRESISTADQPRHSPQPTRQRHSSGQKLTGAH